MRQKKNPPHASLQTPHQGQIPFVASSQHQDKEKGVSLPMLLLVPTSEKSLPGGVRDGQMITFHH